MSESGSSGSSTNSNPRSQDGTSQAENPSKKRKAEGSPSDPIHWLYEHLSESIDREYSQYDWAKTTIAKLRQDSQRSASNLVTIVKFALDALHKSSARGEKECAALKRKLESLEQKAARPADLAAAAKRAQESAAKSAKNEPLLLIIESISFVKPFGKFDLSLYPSLITLLSKKGDQQAHVLLDDVENVIRVVSPTSKDEIVALPLRRALTLGKASHDVIALKLKAKDVLAVMLQKAATSGAQVKGKTAAELKAMICSATPNASQSLASLFSFLTANAIDMEDEAVFRSMSASRTCIICHHKASHGILWPLKNGILFGLKPLTWLPAAAILKVDFVRASRYFELVVAVRGVQHTYNFEMIEIEEESALARYCSLQKFGQRSGKQEALYNKDVAPSRSGKNLEDSGADAGETSSDDSDFVMDISSASSIPEDYDSEVEETDSNDDDHSTGSDAGDDSENETDPNSAADDHTQSNAAENDLDAFAVVSGSESDS